MAGASSSAASNGDVLALDRDLRVLWSHELSGLITQTGLVDTLGHYYIGAGNELHAFAAESGDELWKFKADAPATTGAFLDWFEGGLALFEDGTLLAPNDDFRVYAVDRKTGKRRFAIETPDQT